MCLQANLFLSQFSPDKIAHFGKFFEFLSQLIQHIFVSVIWFSCLYVEVKNRCNLGQRAAMPNHVSGPAWLCKEAERIQSCLSCSHQRNFCVVSQLTLELYMLHTRQDVVTWFVYLFLKFSRKVSWSLKRIFR